MTSPIVRIGLRYAGLSAVAATALTSALFAQTAAPTPPEDVIELSPFVVSTNSDNGYQSTNTQAGARVAVPVRELPLPISILNRDLLDDLAVTDIFQASRMATGGEFINRPDNDTNFQFRGIGSTYQTRNYFIWYLPTDTYSTERVEVLRGPLAVIYGDANPGGVLNIVSKRADLTRNFDRVTARFDDQGSVRGSIDLNHRLPGLGGGVRVNAVYSDGKSWKDWVFNKTQAAHGSFVAKVTKTTTLRLEAETGTIERNLTANVMVDQFSGTTFAGSAVGPNNGPRNVLPSNGTLLLNNNRVGQAASAPLGAAANQGIFQSNGSGSFLSDPNALNGLAARERNWGGPDGRENRRFKQYAAFVEQRVGEKVTVELVANVQDQKNSILRATGFQNVRLDPTAVGATILTNTTVDPTSATTAVNPNAGRYYIDQQWQNQRISNLVRDYRATVAYTFDVFKFTKQRLVGTIGQRQDDTDVRIFQETLKAGSNLIAGGGTAAGNQLSANVVTRRKYLDADYGKLGFSADPRTELSATNFFSVGTNLLKYNSLAMPGSFRIGGRDRVYTLLGIRRDHYIETRQPNAADAYGNLTPTFPLNTTVNRKKQSRNAGLVVKVVEPVAVFANYGESFRPVSGVRLDGSPFSVQEGKGVEYGVKVDAFGGKVSGAASVFDIKNQGAVFALPGASVAELRAIFPNLPTGFNAQDSQDVRSKGYELEMQVNLIEGLTGTMNYSHSNAETTNIAPGIKALRASINATTNPTGLSTAQIDSYLAGLVEPVRNAGTRNDALNLFTRYTVKTGALKGLYVGAGAQWRSETFLGYVLPTPAPTTAAAIVAARKAEFLPAYTVYNGLVGYQYKRANGQTVTVAVNVDNVTDKTYINAFARGFGQWGSPRSFVLTTTFGF